MTAVRAAELRYRQLPGRLAADPFAGVEAASSVRVVRLRRTPGRTAHRHPHSEEIVYVVEGHGAMWLGETWVRLGPGDLVRVPPGVPHATVPDPGTEMRLVCFFPHPQLSLNTEETEIPVGEQGDGA